MVERQLVGRGIRGQRLLEAFLRVPRHEFVPQSLRDQAYADWPLPIGRGQTISQPYMVASMTNLAAIQPENQVLEVGTGSGYQTAILAELARQVYTVERIAEIAEDAERNLRRVGYTNVRSRIANGTLGWEEAAPFEVIVVTAGAPEAPEPLLRQLAIGGRLVIPIEEGYSQVLYRVQRTSGDTKGRRGSAAPLCRSLGTMAGRRALTFTNHQVADAVPEEPADALRCSYCTPPHLPSVASAFNTPDDFMVAGRRVSAWFLAGTLVCTWMGSGSLFGGATLLA